MRFTAIVAENPKAALTRVHEQLGPEAVIVSVRRMRPDGLAWLWPGNRKIEVTACVPEKPQETKREVFQPRNEHADVFPRNRMAVQRPTLASPDGRWRSIAWLEANGLLPAFSRQLEEKAQKLYGAKALPAMQTEWTAITDLIICHWLPARQESVGTGRPHVFIGPAGSGKTTALCKWMTSARLFNEQRVRVWRLDGESANSTELLTLHCELAGIPMERFWTEPDEAADLQLIDLPGVEMDNPNAMSALRDQLAALPQPHVHLVLNAAYESSILFEQFRAFESFAPEDIIFTHLDEELRRVKLWNFVLGTKCPISFLGAGQKIPGEFNRAEPALLFPQKNTPKH
jgi:flagellar biosynthesis protein FlhF